MVPDALAASVKAIEEAALNQITRLLETSQVIKVDMDVDAPKILIPANVTDDETTSIFLDLGRIVAKSSEIKGQTVEEFRRQKQKKVKRVRRVAASLTPGRRSIRTCPRP